MNLGTMRTELQARGFDYLSSTRANQFLNDAYHEICEAHAWPFLETTTSGTSTLSIPDVREVLYVIDSTNGSKLTFMDVRTLTDLDPDITVTGSPNTTGTATYWWLDDIDSLRVYPRDDTSIFVVRYIYVPPSLSSDSSEPAIPTRYHSLIVDLAAVAAYRDSDNFDAAMAQRAEVERQLTRMAQVLLDRAHDNVDVQILGEAADY